VGKIARDPKYWTEPESFKPERFLDSSIDFKGNNFEYLPFGAGRRVCPGYTFALVIVEYTIALLLYHFDWTLPNGMKHEDLDMTVIAAATAGRKEDLVLIPIVRMGWVAVRNFFALFFFFFLKKYFFKNKK
jgi:cytochrome P450